MNEFNCITLCFGNEVRNFRLVLAICSCRHRIFGAIHLLYMCARCRWNWKFIRKWNCELTARMPNQLLKKAKLENSRTYKNIYHSDGVVAMSHSTYNTFIYLFFSGCVPLMPLMPPSPLIFLSTHQPLSVRCQKHTLYLHIISFAAYFFFASPLWFAHRNLIDFQCCECKFWLVFIFSIFRFDSLFFILKRNRQSLTLYPVIKLR